MYGLTVYRYLTLYRVLLTSHDNIAHSQELARKKNKGYSSDSMSDYDHEEHEPPSPDQPKSFEDLLALANRKDQENRKELEMRKQVHHLFVVWQIIFLRLISLRIQMAVERQVLPTYL